MTNIRKKDSMFALVLFINLTILFTFLVSGPLMTRLLQHTPPLPLHYFFRPPPPPGHCHQSLQNRGKTAII